MFRETVFLFLILVSGFSVSAFADLTTFIDLENLTKEFKGKAERQAFSKSDIKDLQKHLSAINGKSMSIKGFLYQNAKGKWLLSPEPKLKTCCIGGKKKLLSQIYLDASFDSSLVNQVVTAEGVFSIEERHDEEGDMEQLLFLKYASLQSGEKGSKLAPLLLLGAAAILLLYFMLGNLKRVKKG
jgi:hypothetical protein